MKELSNTERQTKLRTLIIEKLHFSKKNIPSDIQSKITSLDYKKLDRSIYF